MATIGASVGKGGANKPSDVLTVQKLLNAFQLAQGQPGLIVTGSVDGPTIVAIQAYQAKVVGLAAPDGRIDPGGKTWTALAAGTGLAPPYSGAGWWHANQAKYPNSAALADLAPPFRDNAAAFVKALRDAGATVTVSATRRNETRARLMHYCWQVAHGTIAPAQVPPIPGCAIAWDHGDLAKSKAGAKEMVDLFGIAFEPSLTSLHIQGRAVDMTIAWSGTLAIADRAGKIHSLGAPRSGETNRDLHAVGATYQVFKLLSDPPHWSETGH
ncbi:MAG: hypothetical protein WDN44_13950 [Sphingomonas sp.]